MASSDNVLRGGLTAKHVDLAALIEVLDSSDGKVPVLPRCSGPGGLRYPVPVEDFDLTRCQLDAAGREPSPPAARRSCSARGHAVLRSADGEITLDKGSRCSCRPARR